MRVGLPLRGLLMQLQLCAYWRWQEEEMQQREEEEEEETMLKTDRLQRQAGSRETEDTRKTHTCTHAQLHTHAGVFSFFSSPAPAPLFLSLCFSFSSLRCPRQLGAERKRVIGRWRAWEGVGEGGGLVGAAAQAEKATI